MLELLEAKYTEYSEISRLSDHPWSNRSLPELDSNARCKLKLGAKRVEFRDHKSYKMTRGTNWMIFYLYKDDFRIFLDEIIPIPYGDSCPFTAFTPFASGWNDENFPEAGHNPVE